jgi:hypothetical protein
MTANSPQPFTFLSNFLAGLLKTTEQENIILDNTEILNDLKNKSPTFNLLESLFPIKQASVLPPNLLKTRDLETGPSIIKVKPNNDGSITLPNNVILIEATLGLDISYLLEAVFQITYETIQNEIGFRQSIQLLNELTSYLYENNNKFGKSLNDYQILQFVSCLVNYKWAIPKSYKQSLTSSYTKDSEAQEVEEERVELLKSSPTIPNTMSSKTFEQQAQKVFSDRSAKRVLELKKAIDRITKESK